MKSSIKIMEVCGTHTSAIFRSGIRSLLPENIKLVSGPGCPVCVTPESDIYALTEIAKEAVVLSFGDMFRVPGSRLSLAEAKAQGADIRLMYSPFEVLELARKRPDTNFVIAAVGFETTAPVYSALIETLIAEGIKNVLFYTALKTIPEALDFICKNEVVDAFICPGHVSTIIGSIAYKELCEEYKKPFVIAGFEPEQILEAVKEIIKQTEKNSYCVKNLYFSVVSPGGQKKALALINKYYEKTDSLWRGIGNITNSGLKIKNEYSQYSANKNITKQTQLTNRESQNTNDCRCADVMLGRINPDECPLFKKSCSPQHPQGACMVSSEGACGIWFKNL